MWSSSAAGPAGLLAARDLAAPVTTSSCSKSTTQIGVPVHCTGVLGLDAFDELDLPRDTILETAHAARFVSADGSSVPIDAERVRAAIVDRGVVRPGARGRGAAGGRGDPARAAACGRSM